MANFKYHKPRSQRNRCHMCKPHKENGNTPSGKKEILIKVIEAELRYGLK